MLVGRVNQDVAPSWQETKTMVDFIHWSYLVSIFQDKWNSDVFIPQSFLDILSYCAVGTMLNIKRDTKSLKK